VRIRANLIIPFYALGFGILSLGCSLFAYPLYAHGVSAPHYAFSDLAFDSSNNNLSTATFLAYSQAPKPNDYRIDNPSDFGLSRFSVKSTESDFKTKLSLLQRPQLSTSLSSPYIKHNLTAHISEPAQINYKRASFIGLVNAGTIGFGFKQAMSSWGRSNGRFHIKDDWKGDHLSQTDELSHFMWGYKMTEFLLASYRWAGFSSKTTEILSLSESALILTLVEYPIDAYNPKQGLGVSDLIFDYLGVGLAWAKKHESWLGDLDLKISWKNNIFSSKHPVFAQTYEEYDNTIYWITYRAKLFLPRKILCFGLGYGVIHHGIEPQRQTYCGIGLSLSDSASLFGKKLKNYAKFIDLLYPNLRVRL
jgi:hypothetical protein